MQRIGMSNRVALDTEADSLHNYFAKVCLIQLSFSDEHYLIDPLCGLDLSGFLGALAEKPLIVHGGDYDLRMLRHRWASECVGNFRYHDRGAIARLRTDRSGRAHRALFRGHDRQSGQKSDWSRRPLSEHQLRYAVSDTRSLENIADRMRSELDARGRLDWHRESCRAMVQSTGRESARDPENAWRIKGAGRLTRRQLAYLRELWHWRDQHARNANWPAFKILGNPEFWAWSNGRSLTRAPLQQGPKLPRNIAGTPLTTLEEAIARVMRMDEETWPEPRNATAKFPHRLRRGDQCVARRMRADRQGTGNRGFDFGAQSCARGDCPSRPRGLDEIMKSGGLLRWQAGLVQGAVEKCLRLNQ